MSRARRDVGGKCLVLCGQILLDVIEPWESIERKKKDLRRTSSSSLFIPSSRTSPSVDTRPGMAPLPIATPLTPLL